MVYGYCYSNKCDSASVAAQRSSIRQATDNGEVSFFVETDPKERKTLTVLLYNLKERDTIITTSFTNLDNNPTNAISIVKSLLKQGINVQILSIGQLSSNETFISSIMDTVMDICKVITKEFYDNTQEKKHIRHTNKEKEMCLELLKVYGYADVHALTSIPYGTLRGWVSCASSKGYIREGHSIKKHISKEQWQEIEELLKEHTYKEVSSATGICLATLYNHTRQCKINKTTETNEEDKQLKDVKTTVPEDTVPKYTLNDYTKVREKLYRMYQLDWLMQSNYGVEDISNALVKCGNYNTFMDVGLPDGSIYNDYSSFLNYDYCYKEYIIRLINNLNITEDRKQAILDIYNEDIAQNYFFEDSIQDVIKASEVLSEYVKNKDSMTYEEKCQAILELTPEIDIITTYINNNLSEEDIDNE